MKRMMMIISVFSLIHTHTQVICGFSVLLFFFFCSKFHLCPVFVSKKKKKKNCPLYQQQHSRTEQKQILVVIIWSWSTMTRVFFLWMNVWKDKDTLYTQWSNLQFHFISFNNNNKRHDYDMSTTNKKKMKRNVS